MNLGIIDSGLGGISILKTIRENNPNINILCLADQGKGPYGNQSSSAIIEYTADNILWMEKQGVKRILLACNTSSSVALNAMQEQFPNLIIEGIIDLTAGQLKDGKEKAVLVLATSATVESAAYVKSLKEYCPSLKVYQQALPKLVDFLEGQEKKAVIDGYLTLLLQPYRGAVDAVILGCTHYILVEKKLKSLLNCRIYNSNNAIATCDYGQGQGITKLYTTKDADTLKSMIKTLYQLDLEVNSIQI